MATTKKPTILIINPNTTKSMTEALKPIIDHLGLGQQTSLEYFTAPHGVPSINNEHDEEISTKACLEAFEASWQWFSNCDAYLVCCYSKHSLVPQIRARLPDKAVTGIFEASVATCLQTLNMPFEAISSNAPKFGIVSTGKQWEKLLKTAVADLLGSENSIRYAGTETTGLNADELHTTPKHEVDEKMKAATKRLLGNGAQAVCLGCAGMAGMDQTVREACVEHLGEERGNRVRIVDGVAAGVLFLDGALRAGYYAHN